MRSTYHYFFNDHLSGQLDFKTRAIAHSVYRGHQVLVLTDKHLEKPGMLIMQEYLVNKGNKYPFSTQKAGSGCCCNLVTIVSCGA